MARVTKLGRRVLLAVAAATAVAAGCGSSKNGGFSQSDSPTPETGTTPGPTVDAGFAITDAPVDGSCASVVHCSKDLHQVLDCNDDVVQTCPSDQGCAAGACVPACAAAEQNRTTNGCDFYAVTPDTTFAAGSCYAAFVANTWDTPVTITADYAGTPLAVATMGAIPSGSGVSITYEPLPNGQLPPGKVALLFLANSVPDMQLRPACPSGITPGLTSTDPAPHGTSVGHAFHITTSAPVVAYDIFPYGGGAAAITSASLLLPTPVWDTNYVGVEAYKAVQPQNGNEPYIDIVARADGTKVTILPTSAIAPVGAIAGGPAGVPETYTLNAGEVLHFAQEAELTGSPIQADKPIGVIAGHQCMDVPLGNAACDSAHQMLPPVRALGSEYVAVRYRNRFAGKEESPPWRIVGAADGTVLTWEPSTPPGAPTTLHLGQAVDFRASGPFVARSQDAAHPFYLAGYMTGCLEVDPDDTDCRGDPEFVNVVPPQQYLSSYTFFTDPTYPETNLVVVRTKHNGVFEDVTLDCAGTLTGWTPADSSGNYEYARVDLSTGTFAPVGACNNGLHQISSKAPFGLTVWGWGTNQSGIYTQCVSYAYPAGASVQPINTVVVPPSPH